MARESVLRSVVRVDISQVKAKIRVKKHKRNEEERWNEGNMEYDQKINLTVSLIRKFK